MGGKGDPLEIVQEIKIKRSDLVIINTKKRTGFYRSGGLQSENKKAKSFANTKTLPKNEKYWIWAYRW